MKERRRKTSHIRCRHITDLASCHAAFQETRFQNLFCIVASRILPRHHQHHMLSPWEKLAMLETVVSRGRLNSLNKVDYTLSTACRDARSIGFSAYLLTWPTSSRPRRMTINTKHTIIDYCRVNTFFYWVNIFTRKLNIFSCKNLI